MYCSASDRKPKSSVARASNVIRALPPAYTRSRPGAVRRTDGSASGETTTGIVRRRSPSPIVMYPVFCSTARVVNGPITTFATLPSTASICAGSVSVLVGRPVYAGG